MSDWKARVNQTVSEIGRTIQQGVDHVQAGFGRLAWPPTASGMGLVVGIPLVSLVTEDAPESAIWRAGGTDARGNWQFEIHNGRPEVLRTLGGDGQAVIEELARRHTWSWPAPAGDGALVCQDEGSPNRAACYAHRQSSVLWATAWGPDSFPDPRELAVRLARAVLPPAD